MTISAAITTSNATASAFTRSLFEDPWDADRVITFVNQLRNATIATVNAAGQPHAAVVIAASVRDELYFTVHPSSVLARNLAANDRIGVSVCDTAHAVMAQGRADRVGGALEHQSLIDELAAVTRNGTFTPPGWDGDLYRADLQRLVAN